MALFNYVDLGAGLPPDPIVSMNIYPPEWERTLTENLCYSCTAFLDTGSDCTLLPLNAIAALNLTTFKANAQIVGVGGGQMQGLGIYSIVGLAAPFAERLPKQRGNRVWHNIRSILVGWAGFV